MAKIELSKKQRAVLAPLILEQKRIETRINDTLTGILYGMDAPSGKFEVSPDYKTITIHENNKPEDQKSGEEAK